MTFGLKNVGATYQGAMNLIFHDLLGVLLEVYINDLVIKSAGFEEHLADLSIVLARMRSYNLKMNLLKCAFGASARKFLRFIVHENRIEIDPKKIESIKRVKQPTCKRDAQKLLGKIKYLRRFITNLPGKIDSFLPLVRLKQEEGFLWGEEQKLAFDKEYLASPPVLHAPCTGRDFKLHIAARDCVTGAVLT
jgi:hypothetical protein